MSVELDPGYPSASYSPHFATFSTFIDSTIMPIKQLIKRAVPAPVLELNRRIRNHPHIQARREARVVAERLRGLQQRMHLSQVGQDYWVYGEVFNEKRRGFFVDVGAHDGVNLSNTYLLESRYDWKGICIEAHPQTFRVLQENRRAACVNACIDCVEETVLFADRGLLGGIVSADCDNRFPADGETFELSTTTLARVLDDLHAPEIIDYLSMDIEGAEERALSGFPFDRYCFTCMTIERPSTVVRDLLRAHGYILVKEFPGLDCFYVHQSFSGQYLNNAMAFYQKHLVLKEPGRTE